MTFTNPQYSQPQFPQFPQQQQPQVNYQQGFPMPQQPQQPMPQPVPQQQMQQPQQPVPEAVQGTVDDWLNKQQSTAYGPAVSFKNKPDGTYYEGVVARTITNSDIEQQTNMNTGAPEFYSDGNPKLVMKVPLDVAVSQDHPEGRATWYVSGKARDELLRAMAEAGAPTGPPEKGAAVRVTLTGRTATRFGNPRNEYRVDYARPAGVAAPEPRTEAPAQPVATEQQAQAPQAPAQSTGGLQVPPGVDANLLQEIVNKGA